MTLLSRLFKPRIQKAPSVDEQIRALDGQPTEQLIALIAATENDEVRDAAIAQLTYGPDLLKLAVTPANTRLQLIARKRIGQLLDQKVVTIRQLASEVKDPLNLVTLASYSQQANLEVVETIDDPALLLQLAGEGSTTQLRQAATARIETRPELEKLCKVAQGKDKAVYKLAKAKLDVFKAGDVALAEARAALAQVCEKLEKLARFELDNMFLAKAALLENEWNQLADKASAELTARYQQAQAACQEKIAAHAEQLAQAEEKALLDQQASAFVHTANDEIRTLIADICGLNDIAADTVAAYRQQLSNLTQAVRLASNRELELTKPLQDFERAHQQASQLLENFSAAGTLVQLTAVLAASDNEADLVTRKKIGQYLDSLDKLALAQPVPAVEAARIAVSAWDSRTADKRQRDKDALRSVSELTRKGLWAAQQGMVSKARGVHKELLEKRALMGDLPPAMQAKLEELEQAIARLSDWHEFAVTPKKEALVAHMQELSSSNLHPNDLASKIHELQDEWKSLSRGVQQADEELWQQFQQASQVAFEPCKEYFNEQTRTRELNLGKRRELIAHLETYLGAYDWTNAAWGDVEKTLKLARQEWQSYWPVPRKAAEELQSTFDRFMDELYQRLKDHYQSNKLAKQQLIDQAQALVSAENLGQAIEQTKRLQTQWKAIGKSFAKEDQQLWREFRKHCDAIFARRTQEVAEQDQQRHAQIEQANALIAEANELFAHPATELATGKEAVNTLKERFNACDLPRDKAKSLHAEFDAVLTAIDNKIRAERNHAEIRSWQDLFGLGDQLRQLELAHLAGADTTSLANELSQQLEQPPKLPAGGLAVLRERLAQASTITHDQQQHNSHQLRLLCVRAEILTNRETPEADKPLRMTYLMQQLQQGIGQRDENPESLTFEWIALAAVDDANYEPLFRRFMECLSQPG